MTNDEQIRHLSFGCHIADRDVAPGISVREEKGGGVSTYFGWQCHRVLLLSDVGHCGVHFVVMHMMDVVEEKGCALLLMSKSNTSAC